MSQLLMRANSFTTSFGQTEAMRRSLLHPSMSTLAGDEVLLTTRCWSLTNTTMCRQSKDHERMRRAGIDSISYDPTSNTPLPSRAVTMKNKHNEPQLSKILSTYNLGKGVTVENRSDGVFAHDEADITMISYLLLLLRNTTLLHN